jgi:hypothetical protein
VKPRDSDLTLFAIPKNFRGHIATIQRNAITSWTRLDPRPEIFLFGEEEGTAELARELGIQHFPEVARNEFGTPLLHDLFRQAIERASTPLVGYVNADIVLTSDFIEAVDRVRASREKFMAVGRRWDVDWDQPLDFSRPGWAEIVRDAARRANVQRPGNYIDYFIFTRGLLDNLLPLAIGRFSWDNYLLWRGRSSGAALVDVSPVVLAIHQNHDYAHSKTHADVRQSPELKRNRALVGPWWHMYTIEDATEILNKEGAHPSHRHWWLMAKRLWSHPLTIFQLPWLAVQRLVRTGERTRKSVHE